MCTVLSSRVRRVAAELRKFMRAVRGLGRQERSTTKFDECCKLQFYELQVRLQLQLDRDFPNTAEHVSRLVGRRGTTTMYGVPRLRTLSMPPLSALCPRLARSLPSTVSLTTPCSALWWKISCAGFLVVVMMMSIHVWCGVLCKW